MQSVRGCYRQSRTQTAAVALLLGAHRALGTWRERVNTYIAPSDFCQAMLVRSGLPADKIAVKPHFVPELPALPDGIGRYAIFIGRLSAEKGILPLLRVWRKLTNFPLLVVGDGPLHSEAVRIVASSDATHIQFAGQLSHRETVERIRAARFLLAPSRCYETFGMAVVEAAACGVPAIASRLGALAELVSEQRTGLLFNVEDPEELADVVRWAWAHPREMSEMGRAARENCVAKYSPEKNYRQLLGIYGAALGDTSRTPQMSPVADRTKPMRTRGIDVVTAE